MPGTDGVNSGLQLWLNLPSSEKMCEPRYQDLEPEVASPIFRGSLHGVDFILEYSFFHLFFLFNSFLE